VIQLYNTFYRGTIQGGVGNEHYVFLILGQSQLDKLYRNFWMYEQIYFFRICNLFNKGIVSDFAVPKVIIM